MRLIKLLGFERLNYAAGLTVSRCIAEWSFIVRFSFEVLLQGGFTRKATIENSAEQFFFRNLLIFGNFLQHATMVIEFRLLKSVRTF